MDKNEKAWRDLLEAVTRIPDELLSGVTTSPDSSVLQYEDQYEDECPGCCLCGICKCDGRDC